MSKRTNYYRGLAADFSRPAPLDPAMSQRLIQEYERYTGLRQEALPPITADYGIERIEAENREWWPARCAVIRLRRFELMAPENAADFAYLCQDGPFLGNDPRGQRVAANWGAILCQSACTLVWPVVMFHGEVVFFEWAALDDETSEITASGNVTFLRRGHAGGCYVKTEHLSFFRDVSAAAELLSPASAS
jgi:hypothetical protein